MCYPGDVLLCEMPSLDDFNENEEKYEDNLDEEDEYINEVVLCGAHVPSNNILDDEAAFDGTESTLTAYDISVDNY